MKILIGKNDFRKYKKILIWTKIKKIRNFKNSKYSPKIKKIKKVK